MTASLIARAGAAALLAVGVTGLVQPPALAAQGCTGATASTVARTAVPFGAAVVAPTAQAVDRFGQVVIVPEAMAPHDDCPPAP